MITDIKKAVLLDAGGVLLDESEMESRICKYAVPILKAIVPDYTEEQFWKDTQESVAMFAPRTRPYIFWKYSKGDVTKYRTIRSEFRQAMKEITKSLYLMDGIAEELKILSEKFALVIAGQYGANLIDLLQSNNLAHLFVTKLTQDDFAITKPDPRYLEQIAHATGYKTQECIMVGDRIDNDIIPGKQNQMGTVFVKTGIYKYQLPRDLEEQPDLVLESVAGLGKAIVNRWP